MIIRYIYCQIFCLFWATPMACGSSQARDRTRAIAGSGPDPSPEPQGAGGSILSRCRRLPCTGSSHSEAQGVRRAPPAPGRSSLLPTRFHVSRGTLDHNSIILAFIYRTITFYGGTFQFSSISHYFPLLDFLH